MIKITMNICKKCGYKWIGRKKKSIIRECPACKSRNWNK